MQVGDLLKCVRYTAEGIQGPDLEDFGNLALCIGFDKNYKPIIKPFDSNKSSFVCNRIDRHCYEIVSSYESSIKYGYGMRSFK